MIFFFSFETMDKENIFDKTEGREKISDWCPILVRKKALRTSLHFSVLQDNVKNDDKEKERTEPPNSGNICCESRKLTTLTPYCHPDVEYCSRCHHQGVSSRVEHHEEIFVPGISRKDILNLERRFKGEIIGYLHKLDNGRFSTKDPLRGFTFSLTDMEPKKRMFLKELNLTTELRRIEPTFSGISIIMLVE